MPPAPYQRHVAVVGLGLIGGSLALRLSAHGFTVTAYDADGDTRSAARSADLDCAETLPDLLRGLPGDAIVVLAVPLPALLALLPTIAEHAPSSVTVTDVASVKSPVAAAAAAVGLAGRYVGAHPMAGTAESGFASADPDLLNTARWVVTVDDHTAQDHWLRVAHLVTAIGGTISPATSADHDTAVAWISHLPHVLAEILAAGAPSPLALGLAAGSFRDATRVALTRPELVEAMLAGNASAVDATLGVLIDRLTAIRRGAPVPVAEGYAVRTAWPSDPAGMSETTIDLSDGGWRASLRHLGADGGYLVSTEGLAVTGLTSPGSGLR